MIKQALQKLEGQIAAMGQLMMHPPRSVRIKEFFPQENAVTVQFINALNEFGGATPADLSGDQKFPLGYRGDVSESMSPQPGDIGQLFYSGFQYKRGFVLLTHTEGGGEAMSYVPIRGSWGL